MSQNKRGEIENWVNMAETKYKVKLVLVGPLCTVVLMTWIWSPTYPIQEKEKRKLGMSQESLALHKKEIV